MKPNFYDRYKSSINIGVGVIAIAGAYGWYKSEKHKEEIYDAFRGQENVKNELDQLIAQGYRANHGDSEYYNMADILHQAMTGCATDENAIYGVFRNITGPVDIRKLMLAFGVRYYEPCPWSQFDQWVWSWFKPHAYGGDLPAWLIYELNGAEVAKLNEIIIAGGNDYVLTIE